MPVSAVRAHSYSPEEIRNSLLRAFKLLDLPPDNPFSGLIKPGNTVFLKPNWVAHRYRASCPRQHDVFTTITHPAVIREVARFVDIALAGSGRILIGDNPSIDADFAALMNVQDLASLKDQLNTPVDFVDLRPLNCSDLRHYGRRDMMDVAPGDPTGETLINLGSQSKLAGLNPRLFRGVFNERTETVNAHSNGNHMYSISNSIFKSDVFISIPKLKTHHKVGVTLNLKGLVGTVGVKNYLVHWREGFPAMGGDAYPNFFAWLKDRFQTVKKRGAWHGNDTIWRMVVDLHSCMSQSRAKCFSIVDGIMGGEGDGPFCPEPKRSNVLIVGTDFVETDIVASTLMGFNVQAIAYLQHFMQNDARYRDISFRSDCFDPLALFTGQRFLGFKPPTHWPHLAGQPGA